MVVLDIGEDVTSVWSPGTGIRSEPSRVALGTGGRVRDFGFAADLLGGSSLLGEATAHPDPYRRRELVDELTTHLAGKASDAFIFTSSRGGPLRHSNFYARHFKPAVLRAGLPEQMRFHDLRHSYAAMLIAEGAHPRAIMERMGHSTIQVTLGTYGHLFPTLEAALTDSLDEMYRKAEPLRSADVRDIGS